MLTDECVSQERLAEYSLGMLSDEESSRIEEHLGACPACEGTLGQTDAAADSVVDAIRQPGLDDSASQDRWFRQAADRLKGLDPSSSLGLERSSLTHLTLPLQLRDYELREKIGEGGMGVVYRAVHTRLNKDVAVKLLSSHRLRDAGAVLRFQREMQAVGQLDHPSIVRATDAGEIDGTHFLVMEYVPGVDLGTLVRAGGPLSVADACALIRRAAEGLQHVHESEIVHRDVKPSNLLLSEAGDVKILDLGLARVEQLVETSSELTSLGQLMGTLEYMAPEQCDDSHQVDARADIYALGATLYKLLTGQTPFNGDGQRSPVGKLSAIANEPFPSAPTSPPNSKTCWPG